MSDNTLRERLALVIDRPLTAREAASGEWAANIRANDALTVIAEWLRDRAHEVDLMRTQPPAVYSLTCYGETYGTEPTEATARATAQHHIREDCPHGAMPWAKQIRWDYVDLRSEGAGHGWVSAANGEWLNHRIDVIDPLRGPNRER